MYIFRTIFEVFRRNYPKKLENVRLALYFYAADSNRRHHHHHRHSPNSRSAPDRGKLKKNLGRSKGNVAPRVPARANLAGIIGEEWCRR